MLRQADIATRLKTKAMGRTILTLNEVDSTNQALLNFADSAPDGMVITSEIQTAGRGRHRRLWFSPPGTNLYFSIFLRPGLPATRLPQIPMLTACALHRMLLKIAPEMRCQLKWPNDIWCNERKLSGILCECPPANSQPPTIVVGIGINVNSNLEDFPPDLRDIATSMAIASEHPYLRETVLAEFLNEFDALYDQWKQEEDLSFIADYWAKYDLLKGRNIGLATLEQEIRGTVVGYTPQGFMLFQLPDGTTKTVSAGDVHLNTHLTPPQN